MGLVSDVTASPQNPITESAVSAAKDAALAAIAAAGTIAELKGARTQHAGENSPLAVLNAELRNVPNDQKAASGKLVWAGSRAREPSV